MKSYNNKKSMTQQLHELTADTELLKRLKHSPQLQGKNTRDINLEVEKPKLEVKNTTNINKALFSQSLTMELIKIEASSVVGTASSDHNNIKKKLSSLHPKGTSHYATNNNTK